MPNLDRRVLKLTLKHTLTFEEGLFNLWCALLCSDLGKRYLFHSVTLLLLCRHMDIVSA